jgi:formiminoglutamate deiminase
MHPRPANQGSLWFATALLPAGWANGVRITVRDGVIHAVDTGVAIATGDEQHAIGIPGAGNVHSHAFQRAIAGLTEHRRGSDSFWSWRDVMYGFVAKMNPDQLEAIAAQAYMEMLECGITRVGEFHYLHHAADGKPYAQIAEHAQRLCAAADRIGIGLTLLPVLYAHGGVGGQAPQASQHRFINSIDSFARLLEETRRSVAELDHGRTGIAAHSLRAVTPEELHELLLLDPGGPIHIHIAEQLAEVEQWQKFSGSRPIDWLLDHAAVDERWCLVHATHLSAAELQRLADSKAVVGLCPITEANLGDGVFAAKEYLALDGRFGIGTDSNILIDFAEELRLLEYGQRLMHRERNALHCAGDQSTGRCLFERSLAGSTQVLCRESGQLAPGFLADIVALSDQDPALKSRRGDALLDSWIFAGASIATVWCAGRKVVTDGRHYAREDIAARYSATLHQLLV